MKDIGSRSPIRPITSTITTANRWDHFLARWGYNRRGHRVEPGLCSLGDPTPDSPVLVTANYTLSFDALRAALAGIDGYILVLDTRGINVWCAAGKGTFGTDELVRRIEETSISNIVNNRLLILPQLGATGVSAHEVKRRSGFQVEYGPVRAADLPEYLKTRRATSEMRKVRFRLRDRVILIPVDLVRALLPMAIAGLALYVLGGFMASMAVVSSVLAGVVLFPLLLPWLPTRDFSSKGFVLGELAMLPFVVMALQRHLEQAAWWMLAGKTLAYLLIFPAITAFLSLNFTGSTTFTSKSSVRREIYTYVPIMAVMFGIGIVTIIVFSLV